MDKLTQYREEIDKIDTELLSLFEKRLQIVKKVGEYKKEQNLPIVDPAREKIMLERLQKKGQEYGLDPTMIEGIWRAILHASYKIEE